MKYRHAIGHPLKREPYSKTRVAFVLPRLYTGGAERVLISLMNGLDRSEFEPELISVKEGDAMRDWIAEDIPFHALDQRHLASALPRLLREIRWVDPDVIVSTMAHMNFALLMLRPALRHTRMVVREANIPSSIAENVRIGKPWMVREAYRRLYPVADAVLSPAQCIIDEFRDYLGMTTDNHHLLRNPVDVHRIRKDESRLLLRDANTVNFVAAGRLHRQKGFDRLIGNLHKMSVKKWRLDIYGTGEEMSNLQNQIAGLGLEKNVFLRGLSSDPWPAIASADCFVLPSRWEGLPNVVLESLAAGTKVIATAESGGIRDIANLTKPGDLTVVRTMEEFVGVMNRVTPDPVGSMRPSLLPAHFSMEEVNRSFADIIIHRELPASGLLSRKAV
ncbi:MAG: glycosyltransferase [Alphaproteobacteria bacterium]|nr:glycosyltransferase [Alphaproteobacteria bacterium]